VAQSDQADANLPDQADAHLTETPPAQAPTRQRRRWPHTSLWPWLILLVAALLGIAVGTLLGLRSTSLFPTQSGPAVAARPTIVLSSVPSPSPVAAASPSLPSSAQSAQAQASSASSAASASSASSDQTTRDYVVQPGDTMRSIAQQMYGDPELWPRIYDANRDVIGPNPDDLQVGMHLKIPRT
jgi:nucleoid-associated protein YgaU